MTKVFSLSDSDLAIRWSNSKALVVGGLVFGLLLYAGQIFPPNFIGLMAALLIAALPLLNYHHVDLRVDRTKDSLVCTDTTVSGRKRRSFQLTKVISIGVSKTAADTTLVFRLLDGSTIDVGPVSSSREVVANKLVDRVRRVVLGSTERLTALLLDALCCVMVADGKASAVEKRRILSVMQTMCLSVSEAEVNSRVNEFRVRTKASGFSTTVDQICQELPLLKSLGEDQAVLKCIGSVVTADDQIDKRERMLFQKFRSVLIATPLIECQFRGLRGNHKSIIVDEDRQTIRFENCHLSRQFVPRTAAVFECALSDILNRHILTHRGFESMTIVTSKGKALVPQTAIGYQELKGRLRELVNSTPDGPKMDNPHVFNLVALLIGFIVTGAVIFFYLLFT